MILVTFTSRLLHLGVCTPIECYWKGSHEDDASRQRPCLRLVFLSCLTTLQGLHTGDFHPISSRPWRAYTSPWRSDATNAAPLKDHVIEKSGTGVRGQMKWIGLGGYQKSTFNFFLPKQFRIFLSKLVDYASIPLFPDIWNINS